MHDPALWASWYIWLLVIPAIVIGTVVSDWLQRRWLIRLRRLASAGRASTPARRARLR
ncbi:MAG TPA: hypothetical protein VFQ34_13975 [Nitrospiraceae bacterium]|jgi:uncharacterized membrane-anchored protein|nr:hypothetical protein [Nitrospiraceae bacterium]